MSTTSSYFDFIYRWLSNFILYFIEFINYKGLSA